MKVRVIIHDNEGGGYTAEPRGMTYDAVARRLYLYAGFALHDYPLVYVFSVDC